MTIPVAEETGLEYPFARTPREVVRAGGLVMKGTRA
jgi:hypothetical protein